MFRSSFFARTAPLVAALLTCLFLTACDGECHHLRMETEQIPPDCSSAGYTLNRCSECSYEYKSDFVAPVGHDLKAATTNPTCTSQGYTTYACTTCDFTYVSDYIAPSGHVLQREAVEPSCVSEGYTVYRCDCGYTYTADIVAPSGHNMRSATYAPSCDACGYTEHTCLRCALVYTTDFIEPTGHDFEVRSLNVSTDNAEGYSIYTCRTCGFSYTDALYYSEVFKGAYATSSSPLAHGLDVSKYNHELDAQGNYLPLDFACIKQSGFDFVILKAGSTPRTSADGSIRGGIEPTFEADYAAAKAAGLDVGVYFYTYSTTVKDTIADAELLLGWLDDKQLEYPVYFDIEQANISSMLSRDEITELCITFISTLQQHRYFGAVYTNHNWLINYLDTAKVAYLFDIWYARYPSGDGPYRWSTSSYGRQMGMWQYTQAGKIPAISATTAFDFNYAYKDYPSLIKQLGYNGYPVVAAE